MKYQIRRNIFETNSSSAHCIVVTKNDNKISENELKKSFLEFGDLKHCKNGGYILDLTILPDDMEFGREFRVLNGFREKLSYVIAEYCGELSNVKDEKEKKKVLDGIISELNKEINGIKGVVLPISEELSKDRTKVCRKTYYGYVDHQSQGTVGKFLKDKNISLSEFLLNKKYVIIIDGDEYMEFHNLIDAGIIDENSIEIYNRYQ